MKQAKAATLWFLRLILSQFYILGATDPEELRSGPIYSVFPWVLVICVAVAIIGFLTLLLFLWFHAIREKILVIKLSGQMEEKGKVL
jgi:hypothetical protein